MNAGTYYAVASVAADANYQAATSEPTKLTILKSSQVLTSKMRSTLVTLKAAKKGLKKGAYTLQILASSPANTNYDASERTLYLRILVE